MSIMTLKKALGITLAGVSLSTVLIAPTATAQEACVGESREGESRQEPVGPGNSYREIKSFHLNSCEAKAMHDEAASGKDGDALVAALLGLVPHGGPVVALAHILGSRLDARVVTSSLREASNNFTNGVVVTTEGGQVAGVRPQ